MDRVIRNKTSNPKKKKPLSTAPVHSNDSILMQTNLGNPTGHPSAENVKHDVITTMTNSEEPTTPPGNTNTKPKFSLLDSQMYR
jgi:hypothetical protein